MSITSNFGSEILINNLLNSQMICLFCGAFYRYGTLPTTKENVSINIFF